uniref:Ubiquitin-like domain-containing protein n=1 Tax=Seriola lalandi dorsalis TaxID=1841481 RepID=A0A3B4WV30_SERLL
HGNIYQSLKVNGPRGEEKIIDLCSTQEQLGKIEVGYLKKKIVEELHITGEFRMIFGIKKLEESDLLLSYGIRHMSTIHTVLMLPGGRGGH